MTEQKPKRSNSRATEKRPTRVYSFGCRHPEPEHEQWLRDQAWKANDVQAAMVRNEVATRKKREAIIAKHVPAYRKAMKRARQLSEEIDALYETLGKERQRTRTRCNVPELQNQIAKLKSERHQAYEAAKAAKRPFLAEMKPHWDAMRERKEKLLAKSESQGSRAKGEAQREAMQQVSKLKRTPRAWVELAKLGDKSNRAHCAIRRKDWRPQIDVEMPEGLQERIADAWEAPIDSDVKEMAREAFLAAAKKTGEEGGRMWEPRGSTGRVGVMWSKADCPQVLEGGFVASRKFSLTDAGPDELGTDNRDPNSRRSQLRRRMCAEFVLAGVMVRVRTLVHRQLPIGAAIKRAWLMLRDNGRIDLQLVVQSDTFQRAQAKRLAAVAVKPTWRAAEAGENAATDGAIIAGEWQGSDGESGTIELDARTNQALTIVDRLRQIQDDHHNEARAEVLSWLKSRPSRTEAKLREAMKGAEQWRSPKRLARVAIAFRDDIPNCDELWTSWKSDCLEQDRDLFMPLEAVSEWVRAERGVIDERIELLIYLEWWRRKNNHLHRFEQNMRATAMRRRREGYRVAAARLSGRYERLMLCGVDLKRAARKKLPEQEVEGPEQTWTGQRRRAAPSELTQAMANAFGVTEKAARVVHKSPAEAILREVGPIETTEAA